MNDDVMINKQYIRQNVESKKCQRNAKREYIKGSRTVSKNYIGKVIRLTSEEVVGEKKRNISLKKSTPNKEQMIRMLHEARLLGQSGSGFLVAEKLRSFANTSGKYKVLIVNAAECDPGLLHDEWLLRNKAEEIAKGIEYITLALSIPESYLARKGKKEQEKVVMPSGVIVKEVSARYPSGEEHFLIQEVLGVKLPMEQVPAKIGILVMNVQTVLQVARIVNGEYDRGHYVTLANLTTGEARIGYVKEQNEIRNVLEQAIGKGNYYYAGHGVFGAHPITQGECFTAMTGFAGIINTRCIHERNQCRRCGSCSRHCPMGVKVKELVQALDRKEKIGENEYLQKKCIGCGCCTYYCRAAKDISRMVQNAR